MIQESIVFASFHPLDPAALSSGPARTLTRRQMLQQGAAVATALMLAPAAVRAANPAPGGCTLGFSTYGMKALKTEDAIRQTQAIGFDAIEIAVRPDWDSAPGNMPPDRRAAVGRQLKESGLKLTSLMEHMEPSTSNDEHQQHLIRLAGVCELAADWSTRARPLVQTTLGGGEWEKKQEFYRDRVGDWLEVAEKHEVVLAIKPHRGGGMSQPSEAVWLIQQLGNSKWLRMVYDYSHYAFRDLPLKETIETALPYTAHIAVKDPVQQGDRVVFDLPGTHGTVDFPLLFRKFYDGGYRGDMSCEVSGMVWSRPDYDQIEGAKRCYAAMAKAFEESGVPRG